MGSIKELEELVKLYIQADSLYLKSSYERNGREVFERFKQSSPNFPNVHLGIPNYLCDAYVTQDPEKYTPILSSAFSCLPSHFQQKLSFVLSTYIEVVRKIEEHYFYLTAQKIMPLEYRLGRTDKATEDFLIVEDNLGGKSFYFLPTCLPAKYYKWGLLRDSEGSPDLENPNIYDYLTIDFNELNLVNDNRFYRGSIYYEIYFGKVALTTARNWGGHSNNFKEHLMNFKEHLMGRIFEDNIYNMGSAPLYRCLFDILKLSNEMHVNCCNYRKEEEKHKKIRDQAMGILGERV